jgi:hypothetical protein
MSGKTITGTANYTVTIGSGGYLSPLTIASTAAVKPIDPGQTGIYLPNRPSIVTIVNYGKVNGAPGSGQVYAPYAIGGGIAIDLHSSVTLTNTSLILGGNAGGAVSDGVNDGGKGGNGVNALAAANIVN